MFIREVEVYVGSKNSMEQIAISSDTLFVAFDVKKTNTIQPNTATIEITNLNQFTRSKIENIDKPKWILLRAGYSDETGAQDIYKGTILRVTSQKLPPNIVTTIEAQDGIYQYNIRTSLGYPKGTPVKTMLKDITNKMKLEWSAASCEIPNRSVSFSTCGKSHDSLTRLCRLIGLDHSIQDGKVLFTKTGEGNRGSVILLSAKSGLIGSPKKVANVVPSCDLMTTSAANAKIITTNSGSPTLTIPGWEVESLLLPSVEPKSNIQIDSNDTGTGSIFIVETVNHKGDTASGDFKTTLQVYKKR